MNFINKYDSTDDSANLERTSATITCCWSVELESQSPTTWSNSKKSTWSLNGWKRDSFGFVFLKNLPDYFMIKVRESHSRYPTSSQGLLYFLEASFALYIQNRIWFLFFIYSAKTSDAVLVAWNLLSSCHKQWLA